MNQINPLNNQPNSLLPVRWAQGEHVTVVGETESGKTFLVTKLADMREHVVILRTKPDDNKFPGFLHTAKARAMDDWHNQHILLEPKYDEQARQAWEMLERVWRHGGWTVIIDEQWYVEQELKMRHMIVRLLTQGRSKDITVVNGVQRPVEISRFTISQSKHVFIFSLEGRDVKTVADATSPRIIEPVSQLTIPKHDFIYYHRGRKILAKGNARALNRILS
jgi:hypothetical protein